MLGHDTPLTALDEGLGAPGVSAARLGDPDGSVNYGDENGRAAGRVVGHVLAWRAAFRRRPRRLQLLLAVEIELDDAVVRGRTSVGGRHDQRLLDAAQVRHRVDERDVDVFEMPLERRRIVGMAVQDGDLDHGDRKTYRRRDEDRGFGWLSRTAPGAGALAPG